MHIDTLSSGRRLAQTGIALTVLAGLYACAPAQHTQVPVSSATGLPGKQITVNCTLNAAATEPCRSDAERQCKGEVRLVNVTVAERLPPPTERQLTQGQRVYRAVYSCE